MSETSHQKLFAPLALAILLWSLNVIYHLEFSFWITTDFTTPLGVIQLRDYFPQFAVIVALISGIFLRRQIVSGIAITLTLCAWLLWAVAIAASMAWLLTTKIEAIHFIQYGIIAILFATALDPLKEQWPVLSLSLLVCVLGIIDEANQYFYLAASYGFYLDFNDFFLNQLGCIAGLLLYYGFSVPANSAKDSISNLLLEGKLQGVLLFLLTLLIIVVMLMSAAGLLSLNPAYEIPAGGIGEASGRTMLFLQRSPSLFGSWQPSFEDHLYYVLSPLQGLGLLVASFVLIGVYKFFAFKI